jgi:hypothetical protein
MSVVDQYLRSHFTLGDVEHDGKCYVTGEIEFPESVTGKKFSVPVRRPVPTGQSHWTVVRDTLRQVVVHVHNTADGFKK